MRVRLSLLQTLLYFSMQDDGWGVVVAWLEILFFDNLKAQFRFNALQNHALIDTLSNRSIAARAVVFVHAKGVCCFPESVIIKCLKPFFKVFTVFKVLHGIIVSRYGFISPEQSPKASTCKYHGVDGVISEKLVL